MFLNKFCFSFSPLKYGFSDRERYCNAYMYYYTYYAKSSFKSVYKFDIKLDQAPISIHLQTHWLIDACTRTATGNFVIISRPFIWGKKIYFILTHRQLVWKILIKFNFHFFFQAKEHAVKTVGCYLYFIVVSTYMFCFLNSIELWRSKN